MLQKKTIVKYQIWSDTTIENSQGKKNADFYDDAY